MEEKINELLYLKKEKINHWFYLLEKEKSSNIWGEISSLTLIELKNIFEKIIQQKDKIIIKEQYKMLNLIEEFINDNRQEEVYKALKSLYNLENANLNFTFEYLKDKINEKEDNPVTQLVNEMDIKEYFNLSLEIEEKDEDRNIMPFKINYNEFSYYIKYGNDDFYVIINGEKRKLSNNRINDIKQLIEENIEYLVKYSDNSSEVEKTDISINLKYQYFDIKINNIDKNKDIDKYLFSIKFLEKLKKIILDGYKEIINDSLMSENLSVAGKIKRLGNKENAVILKQEKEEFLNSANQVYEAEKAKAKKIQLKISRQGVCMGDDINFHFIDIDLSAGDSFTTEELLKVIDIWLIKYGNIIWEVKAGYADFNEEILGYIKIEDETHTYNVVSNKRLTEFEQPIFINCNKIKKEQLERKNSIDNTEFIIKELNNNDKIKINLFGIEKDVKVFSTGSNQFDENGKYKKNNFKLNEKEIELLNWFINNINIEEYKEEIIKYCNNEYSMWSDIKITEKDIENEINIYAIAINITERKSRFAYPEIAFYGSCNCDPEHGICIGFLNKEFLGIASQDWIL